MISLSTDLKVWSIYLLAVLIFSKDCDNNGPATFEILLTIL